MRLRPGATACVGCAPYADVINRPSRASTAPRCCPSAGGCSLGDCFLSLAACAPLAGAKRSQRHERHCKLAGSLGRRPWRVLRSPLPALTWPSQANRWRPTGQIGDDARVTTTSADDWSPADNPYAIAVSQSQLWGDIVRLTILRTRDEHDHHAGWFISQQLDAHVLVMTLRQLLTAEQLEQVALKELGIDAAVRDALAEAREKIEDALPGIKHMRDALMHFDEWSRGKGLGPQKARVKAGEALRDVARDYWRFGYDPIAATVSLGPYTIDVDMAERAAHELCQRSTWLLAK
jgi:hypothetical protein